MKTSFAHFIDRQRIVKRLQQKTATNNFEAEYCNKLSN